MRCMVRGPSEHSLGTWAKVALTLLFTLAFGVGSLATDEYYTVFEMAPANPDPGILRELARGIVEEVAPEALDELELLEDEETFSLHVYERLFFETVKATGSIWYADMRFAFNEAYTADVLPSGAAAVGIANSFVSRWVTLPDYLAEGEARVSVQLSMTEVYDTETSEITLRPHTADVVYEFHVQGLPVSGPGAKLRVSINGEGQVVGFHSVLRDAVPAFDVPAHHEDEVRDIFLRQFAGEIESLDVSVEYWAEGEYETQQFMEPFYVFRGYARDEDDVVPLKETRLPATEFSPIALIESPAPDETLRPGETTHFRAEVLGGEPPYRFLWHDTSGELIGEEQEFDAVLEPAERDGVLLPVTVKLTVIDARGSEASTVVTLPVEGGYQTSGASLAGDPGTQEVAAAHNSPNDDANDRELLIEWVNAYTWQSVLYNNDTNARGFQNALTAAGWSAHTEWGDWWAWEEDFKRRSSGGTDFIFIDAVDFAFFSGHGSQTKIYFESSIDNRSFAFTNARWGGTQNGNASEEGDLEWIVLDACLTLCHKGSGRWCTGSGTSVFDRWDQAFDGLHYVLGFRTICSDVSNRGAIFAKYLLKGWSVRNAWIRATQATQGSKYWGAYLRADARTAPTYYDHLPGRGYVSPDPYPVRYLYYCRWPC